MRNIKNIIKELKDKSKLNDEAIKEYNNMLKEIMQKLRSAYELIEGKI